jgi:hypothetical protein
MQSSDILVKNSYIKEDDFPSGVYPEDLSEKMNLYLSQLNDTQLMAFRVAKRHLGSSFNLAKSNGFIEWSKTHK